MTTVTRRSVISGAAAIAAASGLGIGPLRAQDRRVLVVAAQNDITNFEGL